MRNKGIPYPKIQKKYIVIAIIACYNAFKANDFYRRKPVLRF